MAIAVGIHRPSKIHKANIKCVCLSLSISLFISLFPSHVWIRSYYYIYIVRISGSKDLSHSQTALSLSLALLMVFHSVPSFSSPFCLVLTSWICLVESKFQYFDDNAACVSVCVSVYDINFIEIHWASALYSPINRNISVESSNKCCHNILTLGCAAHASKELLFFCKWTKWIYVFIYSIYTVYYIPYCCRCWSCCGCAAIYVCRFHTTNRSNHTTEAYFVCIYMRIHLSPYNSIHSNCIQ